jgi:C_GCAxxG_C_C family probable redox protein
MGKHSEKAAALFDEGFACSQAVLGAFCEPLGMDRALALKIANGFGGGIARRQKICGAVSGAVMMIGLKYGRSEAGDMDAHEKTYAKINAFCEAFEQSNGSIICRDLLGCGMEEAKEKGVFSTLCKKFVRDAADILEELMQAE